MSPDARLLAAFAGITDMCFAFSKTEQQLTARSYPEHDITPPAMTMLVERGSGRQQEADDEAGHGFLRGAPSLLFWSDKQREAGAGDPGESSLASRPPSTSFSA